jgi:hypothetical protein
VVVPSFDAVDDAPLSFYLFDDIVDMLTSIAPSHWLSPR